MKTPGRKKKNNFWNALRASACRRLVLLAAGIHPSFASFALMEILRREPEALKGFIADRASELAIGITMATMDREGLSHCFRCPQRFGLKKMAGGRYACLTHSQEEKALAPK